MSFDNDLEWRQWVAYTLGRHEAMLKVLLALNMSILGLLALVLRFVTIGG